MRLRSIVLLVAAVSLAGCSRSPNIVGNWVEDPASRNTVRPAGNDFAKLYNNFNRIEFRADKRFTRTLFFTLEGTYEVSGDKVTLNYTKAFGMDISKMPGGNDQSKNKPQIGTVSADGKSLTIADDNGKPTKYVRETS